MRVCVCLKNVNVDILPIEIFDKNVYIYLYIKCHTINIAVNGRYQAEQQQ